MIGCSCSTPKMHYHCKDTLSQQIKASNMLNHNRGSSTSSARLSADYRRLIDTCKGLACSDHCREHTVTGTPLKITQLLQKSRCQPTSSCKSMATEPTALSRSKISMGSTRCLGFSALKRSESNSRIEKASEPSLSSRSR